MSNNLATCAKRYLSASAAGGLAPRTIHHYRVRLNLFIDWCGAKGIETVEQVTVDDVTDYIAHIMDTRAQATAKASAVIVKAFFNFCAQRYGVPSPAAALKTPQPKPTRQRTFTRAEIQRLFATCNTTTAMGARDYAMMALLLDSGLRASELLALNVTDLLLDQNKAWVKVKGGAMAVAYYTDQTKRALLRWLEHRNELVPVSARVQPLFISLAGHTPGRRLTPRGLRFRFDDLGELAKVPDVSPHAFRRTFAVFALKAGAPTEVVRRMGRWSTLNEVTRYSQELDLETEAPQYMPMDWLKTEERPNGDFEPKPEPKT